MSISLYIALYYNLLLLLVVYIAIQPVRAETVRQPYINNQIFSLALLLIVYVHVTFRPTDYHYFGDTSAYAMAFQKKAFYGTVAIRDRDIGFEYLTYWLSQLVNLKGYWFVLCSLYILPVFFALKKRFKQQYAVALVLFVCSLSFWGYGVNGLRNGIATSLVIFSFLVPNNDIKRIPVWIIACLFHQSVMLPIGCFLLTRLSNNPKHYLYLWGTLFMFMFGMINDSNLLFTKASIKLLIWFSLFMIFLAKVKDENEKISRIRIKAICYAIYLLGIYYIVMLVRGVYNGNLEEADNSIAIVYMVFNVICLEFGVQKSQVDRLFKK